MTGVDAVRLKAVVGSDYPPGNEAGRRKTYAIRAQGEAANFLTLIEPYEDKAAVKSASARGPGQLRVELTDGRIQDITLSNFTGSGKDLGVTLRETKDGQVVRIESTTPSEDGHS
jgi:hypothetical protein